MIPFLGDVARLGTGLFAFCSAIVVALTVVSIAWLFYRPRMKISRVFFFFFLSFFNSPTL